MQDSVIIWNFLVREFPDDHVVIYLYVCGNVRSPKTAISKIMGNIEKIFCPPFSEAYVLKIVKAFLEHKKKQYMKGEIKVVPIY